jgi:hypothetical protein
MKLFVDIILFFVAAFAKLFWARKEEFFYLRVNSVAQSSFAGERMQSYLSPTSISSQYTATQVNIYYHLQSHFPTSHSVLCILHF